MFDAKQVVPEFESLLGWRDDVNIDLPLAMNQSETGEFYNSKHPALKLSKIQAVIPANKVLEDYLTETVEDATTEMLNDLLQYRKLNNYGKSLLEHSVLLDKYGWKQDVIINQGRFVGMQVRLKNMSGLKAVINEIGFQFSQPEAALKIYLFHTSKEDPIDTFDVAIDGNGNWSWIKKDIELTAFKSANYHGGAFIVGYYQEDLTGNAINYTNFNWDTGVCGSCNNPHLKTWRSIRNNFHVYPLYVPAGSFTKGKMFDLSNDAIFSNSESYGLNFRFTVKCDLTEFFIQNKFMFKNLLALKVTEKILNDLKYTDEINPVEENTKMMAIRDLEGDKETNLLNIPIQYSREIKAVSFDMTGINSKCLECDPKSTGVTYGVN